MPTKKQLKGAAKAVSRGVGSPVVGKAVGALARKFGSGAQLSASEKQRLSAAIRGQTGAQMSQAEAKRLKGRAKKGK